MSVFIRNTGRSGTTPSRSSRRGPSAGKNGWYQPPPMIHGSDGFASANARTRSRYAAGSLRSSRFTLRRIRPANAAWMCASWKPGTIAAPRDHVSSRTDALADIRLGADRDDAVSRDRHRLRHAPRRVARADLTQHDEVGAAHERGRYHPTYARAMQLNPTEEDRLRVFLAAQLARETLARGQALNAPEAVALVCDEMHLAARGGASWEDVVAAGRAVASSTDVLDGVADLAPENPAGGPARGGHAARRAPRAVRRGLTGRARRDPVRRGRRAARPGPRAPHDLCQERGRGSDPGSPRTSPSGRRTRPSSSTGRRPRGSDWTFRRATPCAGAPARPGRPRSSRTRTAAVPEAIIASGARAPPRTDRRRPRAARRHRPVDQGRGGPDRAGRPGAVGIREDVAVADDASTTARPARRSSTR